jgi:hypothetical protein
VFELLSQRKGVIAGRWLDRLVESYPADAANFLKKKGDRFANPVGTTLARGTAAAVEALFDGAAGDALREALEPMIRIRAVQELSPSSAVAFVFELKEVIREVIGRADRDTAIEDELRRVEARIDRMALLAFDIYAACREQVADIRVSELKRTVAHVLRRSGWFDGDSGAEQAPPSVGSCRNPQQGGD